MSAAPSESAARCTVLSAEAATAEGWVRHEEEIRRSRFIAYLGRTADEAAARDMVARLRRSHHDARHVCSAWILGPDRRLMRSNDDGEPAGTAGVPMLEALVQRETAPGRADLTDVCAVVVRYFGGVKLGAGGLVRAYSDVVSRALDGAALVPRRRVALFEVAAPHAEAGRWQHELSLAGVAVDATRYEAAHAVLETSVPDSSAAHDTLTTALARLSAGTAHPEPTGHAWADAPDGDTDEETRP